MSIVQTAKALLSENIQTKRLRLLGGIYRHIEASRWHVPSLPLWLAYRLRGYCNSPKARITHIGASDLSTTVAFLPSPPAWQDHRRKESASAMSRSLLAWRSCTSHQYRLKTHRPIRSTEQLDSWFICCLENRWRHGCLGDFKGHVPKLPVFTFHQ